MGLQRRPDDATSLADGGMVTQSAVRSAPTAPYRPRTLTVSARRPQTGRGRLQPRKPLDLRGRGAERASHVRVRQAFCRTGQSNANSGFWGLIPGLRRDRLGRSGRATSVAPGLGRPRGDRAPTSTRAFAEPAARAVRGGLTSPIASAFALPTKRRWRRPLRQRQRLLDAQARPRPRRDPHRPRPRRPAGGGVRGQGDQEGGGGDRRGRQDPGGLRHGAQAVARPRGLPGGRRRRSGRGDHPPAHARRLRNASARAGGRNAHDWPRSCAASLAEVTDEEA